MHRPTTTAATHTTPPPGAAAAALRTAPTWRPAAGSRGGSSGGAGGRRIARRLDDEAAGLATLLLLPPAAGKPSSDPPAKNNNDQLPTKKQQQQQKKKKKGGGGYSGPSPRQLVRRAGIRARALAGKAARAVAAWPGVRHVLAAAAALAAATLPARHRLAAAGDALAVDYGAFLATETRRTWAWAAAHPVERSVAAEHVRWVRTFILTAAWAAAAPPTIAWTLGVPALLLSAPWGVRGQVKSPVLWAVLFVCQGLGKWPVSSPLMPLF